MKEISIPMVHIYSKQMSPLELYNTLAYGFNMHTQKNQPESKKSFHAELDKALKRIK